ncbi:MAG TPA: hypothetical protein VGQ67_12070, partial [Candidatus Polarisedimenticolia bacterium]|nr:hypothetical protein [Candidatus Polarisedimenticolia bacterium]
MIGRKGRVGRDFIVPDESACINDGDAAGCLLHAFDPGLNVRCQRLRRLSAINLNIEGRRQIP